MSDSTKKFRIGESAGLTLRKVGGVGRFFGSTPAAALIAVCTSCAAPSMLRFRSNWRTMFTIPSPLDEVIWVTPGICANWRSSGVAIDDAIVSGADPENVEVTWMVGKSTCGKAPTGRNG